LLADSLKLIDVELLSLSDLLALNDLESRSEIDSLSDSLLLELMLFSSERLVEVDKLAESLRLSEFLPLPDDELLTLSEVDSEPDFELLIDVLTLSVVLPASDKLWLIELLVLPLFERLTLSDSLVLSDSDLEFESERLVERL